MNKVNNPLTIIAIFAGISEAFATISLIALPLEIQSIFIWFVMIFPVIIAICFFTILINKRESLYAPSDFRDEDSFLSLLDTVQSVTEKELSKLPEEVKERIDSKAISKSISENVQSLNSENIILDLLADGENYSHNKIARESGLSIHSVRKLTESLVEKKVIDCANKIIESKRGSRSIKMEVPFYFIRNQ